MLRLLFILMLLPGISQAQIYKWKDSQGIMHYSDNPQPGAVEVNLPPIQSYAAPTNTQTTTVTQEQSTARHYKSVQINKPMNEDTVRNNSGQVDVVVVTDPLLEPGDNFVMLLDGKPFGGSQTTTVMTLEGVERGTHQLQVKIVDAQGDTIDTSQPVTFYMHQTSKLNKLKK